nr:MAG TPA: hypothetical protein [Caudoviricetes sp.]
MNVFWQIGYKLTALCGGLFCLFIAVFEISNTYIKAFSCISKFFLTGVVCSVTPIVEICG